MELRKVLQISRILYGLIYLAVFAGILLIFAGSSAAKSVFVLSALLALVYFVFTFKYNRCPECGGIVRVDNPFRLPKKCPVCGKKLEE